MNSESRTAAAKVEALVARHTALIVLTRRGTVLADSELRAEYESLKAAGMTAAEKALFFDPVVAMLPDDES